jgi:hypothetical protein
MLTSSLAIAWPLWRRHRLGLLVCLGYLVCAAIVAAWLTTAAVDLNFVNGIMSSTAFLLIGLAAYLVAIFSFGFEADVGARESCFPASLFRLPVGTGSLVGWPMAYGAAVSALLWLIAAEFILRPWLSLLDTSVPLWWPAALAVASFAWFQAVLWVPFGVPLLRIILASVLIPGLVAITGICVQYGMSETNLFVLFAGLAAVGWTVGFIGVKYARRGAIPDWSLLARPWHFLRLGSPRRLSPFANADRAHVWFEWRRNGRGLPILTAVILPFVLLPLLFGKNDAIPTERTLLGALVIPVFLAGLAGTTVSGSNPWAKDYYGIAPSTATLPISTADLVAAKLKAAAWSTAVVWALLAVALPLALLLTGHLSEMADLWQRAAENHQPLKIVAGLMTAVIYLVIWTWKRLVDSLFLGLTGRKWIIQGCIFTSIFGFVALVALGSMIYKNPGAREAVLPLVPWILGLWVLCRLLIASWAVRRMLQQNLIRTRTLMNCLLAIVFVGLAMFGTFAWVLPREWVPLHYLAFAVVLVLPMTRLAGTPLALAWNRHR